MSAGQTGGERERDWDLAFRFGLSYFGGRLDRGLLTRTDISDMLTNAYLLGRDHRPVPVPGQAAREAAVEAVALELWRRYPQTERTALRNARAILADKDVYAALVAALSAAPGQEQP